MNTNNIRPPQPDSQQLIRSPQQIVIAKPLAAGPPTTTGPTLSSGLNSLRRHWKLGIPLGIILATVGASAGWFLLVPQYTASAYLRISSDDRPLMFETADAAANNAASFKLYKNSQAQWMQTPYVLNAALRESGVTDLTEIRTTPDPVNWLQEHLQVDFPADGEIMQVTIETPSPDACVVLVNAVVKAYMDEVVLNEKNARQLRLENLQSVYKDSESKLRNKRAGLKTLAEALGTSDAESLTVAQQSVLQQFGHMQEKLSTIQFQLMQAEGDLKVAQAIEQQTQDKPAASADSEVAVPQAAPGISEADLRTPAVVGLESDLATLQSRLQIMQQSSGEGHPSVRRMMQELQLKEQLLARYKADALLQAEQRALERSGQVGRSLSGGSRVANPLSPYNLLELNTRIEILRSQETALQAKVDDLADDTRQLGKSSLDVELMRAEIQIQEDVLRQVGGEIERTSIELKTASRTTSISPAEKATPPDLKKRLAATGGLGLLGLLSPLGLLIGWDLSRRRVDTVESVNKVLAMSSLGQIPYVDYDPLHPSKQPRPREVRQRLDLLEAVDSVAAMVMHRCQLEDAQVFMLTSAIAGEGKSTIACQLAESLSRSGKQVVLVDFDLRRPSIHEYLKLNRSPGLIDLLFNDASLLDVVQIPKHSRFHVISSGEGIPSLNELAVSGSIEALFDQLRARYDIVIVDACPILPIVDARIVGKYVDAVMLALLRDRSRLPLVTQACEILKSYGVKLMGTILIGAQPPSYQSYYQQVSPQSMPARIKLSSVESDKSAI